MFPKLVTAPGVPNFAIHMAVAALLVTGVAPSTAQPVVARAGDSVLASERQALLDLYDSTNGPFWTNRTNWNGAPGTECTWYGVICDAEQNRVQQLILDHNNLAGTLPSSLGSFTSPQRLILYANQLTGPIPPELGNLKSLQELWLSSNQLSGSIPAELGNLTSLQYLVLQGNQLTGSMPAELGNLTSLQHLYLDTNQLTGSIPATLGNLTNLQTLNLLRNQLTGSIPPELGNLTNLKSLNLMYNQVAGSIPAALGNLTSLQYLRLTYNQLTGSIPAALGNLTSLLGLYFDSNQLTGSIPAALGALSRLQSLSLGRNQLTGSIPRELGDLTSLEYLSLGVNQLTGTIPAELGNLPNLTKLSLLSNQLTGPIPASLGNLTTLRSLYIESNQLTGAIPPALGYLTSLQELYLSNNQLQGSIPAELGNLTNLVGLWLSSNQLTGAVPSSMTSLTNLNPGYNDFRWNGLHSSDPTIVAFLNDKQNGGDWQSTQTVPVTGLAAGEATASSIAVTWTPISYTGDTGGYQVYCSTTSGGPYTLLGMTTDKSATGWIVTGLNPETLYTVVVRSVTDPHGNNQNVVVSDPSSEVSLSTLVARILVVAKSGTGTGTVTSNPAGIDCGATCSASFDHGTPVTLNQQAAPGSRFVGWFGACAGSGTCTVSMTTELAVTARFDNSHGIRRHLQRASPNGTPAP